MAVQTKTGQRLEFSKKDRATVSGNAVLVPDPGGSTVPERFAWDEMKSHRKNEDGQVNFFETKDGRAFSVKFRKTYEKGIIISSGRPYRYLPLSELELVWVRRTNWPATIAVCSLAAIAVAAGAVGIALSNYTVMDNDSCPFVYSYDGREYVLDAEPYGGAVCAGLERVDWVGLDNLKPVDGRCRLLLANELEEVEYVDELKLVVVDHPEGLTVLPELSGKMRTIASRVLEKAMKPVFFRLDGHRKKPIIKRYSSKLLSGGNILPTTNLRVIAQHGRNDQGANVADGSTKHNS